MTHRADPKSPGWEALDELQKSIIRWQKQNFPDCDERELALGVCEEAGELAQCILKMHRGIRTTEFNNDRLSDAIGDIIIFLVGICDSRGFLLSDSIVQAADKVLSRNWRT